MSTRDWGAAGIVVAGLILCAGLWEHGSVTKGMAYRVISGTNDIYAYRFEMRERVTLPALPWSVLHPVAARHARGEAYPAMSGVISCLSSEPTVASVAMAEAQFDRAIALPITLTVMRVSRVGSARPDPADASMVRSDCRALSRVDPTDLSVPTGPSA